MEISRFHGPGTPGACCSTSGFSMRPARRSYGSTQPLSSLTCCTAVRALSWSFQKPADAIRSSSCVSVSRLRSRSKIPPQLEQPTLGVSEPTRALGFSHVVRAPYRSLAKCPGKYDTSRPPRLENGSAHSCAFKIAAAGASNHPESTHRGRPRTPSCPPRGRRSAHPGSGRSTRRTPFQSGPRTPRNSS